MDNQPYTVLGRETSSNVQALCWGLHELGVPYTRHDYGETFGGLDTPEFRALNPHGKIPVLILPSGEALFETPAILRFVASQHGDDAFWPADPVSRAQVDMWAEWAKHEIAEAFTGPIFWRVVRTPTAQHDKPAIASAIDQFESQLALAEPRLAKTEFLCGDALTVADIQFGHTLFRYFDIDIPRRAFPAIENYFAGLKTRVAYQQTVMLDYSALRDTL